MAYLKAPTFISGGSQGWVSKSRYQRLSRVDPKAGFLKLRFLTTFPKWSPGFNVDATLVPQYTAQPRELPLLS